MLRKSMLPVIRGAFVSTFQFRAASQHPRAAAAAPPARGRSKCRCVHASSVPAPTSAARAARTQAQAIDAVFHTGASCRMPQSAAGRRSGGA